ncbi:hypothetical protein [Cupriavidus campinensis]|uniref:BPSL0067 family protein n=1 Tax=Cupriavidus campinensis TaxID=151783 RepID=A0ABY3ETF3_9BURK|nr:hypothetical protein [Cupriavidus campinensis]TSP14013.1 hypothetical protein FGG12_05960 [Cupriavidus campinensis]
MKPTRTPTCQHANRHDIKSVGGLHYTTARMGLPTGVPCVECPARRDSKPGYLGGYSAEMYLSVMHSPASIACHLSPGFQEGDIARQNHCTGVAIYRANVGHFCGSSADFATLKAGRNVAAVFASPEEFFNHHNGHQVKE